jgi:L-ribulose-5-phosphate 3-epimerase UlaE
MADTVFDGIVKIVQVVSVVTGVVVSVLSFNAAREKDAESRAKEAEARLVEAWKPFVQLRQKLYQDTIQTAAVLANSDIHTQAELEAAKKRFRNLYVAELSMVETPQVAGQMVQFAKVVDPALTSMSERQRAAYNLSHKIAESFVESSQPSK